MWEGAAYYDSTDYAKIVVVNKLENFKILHKYNKYYKKAASR